MCRSFLLPYREPVRIRRTPMITKVVLLPPSAVPHISQPLVPKSQWLTASPRGEKPLFDIRQFRSIVSSEIYHPRLLPRGRSCQKSALRNRFLTDVGDRRKAAAVRTCETGNIQDCELPTWEFATFFPRFSFPGMLRYSHKGTSQQSRITGSGRLGFKSHTCALSHPHKGTSSNPGNS